MNREILERYNKVFGVDNAELEKSSCFGKWSGTYDLSVRLGNSSYTLGNSSSGQKYLNERLIKTVELFEMFNLKKNDLLNALKAIQESDNEMSKGMGLNQYEIVDVDFKKQGSYIGWFYIRLKVNGVEFNHLETGLHLKITKFIEDGTPFEKREKYYTAGGLSDAMVDYVFHGVGFSSVKGYKC